MRLFSLLLLVQSCIFRNALAIATSADHIIPSTKYRTSITLALLWDYGVNYQNYGVQLPLKEFLCELAVNETNQDPDILPFTYVNIDKVNSWDPDHPDDLVVIDSGGYTAVQAMNAVANKGPLVTEFNQNIFAIMSSFSAQIFSYYNIPFCGADEASPELSDKNRFSHFFRTTQGRGYGNYLVRFLKYYNVKRVALVVAPDHLSTFGGKDVESALQTAGITILTKVSLTPILIEDGDFGLYYETLRNVDARYIIVLAPSSLLADFYYGSRFYHLIGPQYLWLSWNLPMYDETYDVPAELRQYFDGFLYTILDSADWSSSPVKKFNDTLSTLTNPLLSSLISFSFGDILFFAGAYDCVKLMMRGIHELLQSDPKNSPEMLANGSLNQYLTPDKFANTGYQGVTYSPITLNEYGDLNSSVYDEISEASFLSISFMLGIIGLAVNLATTFSFDPSTSTLLIQNIITWLVANLSLLALYLPKLIEMWTELHDRNDTFDIPSAPSMSVSGTGTVMSAIGSTSAIIAATGSTNEVHANVNHLNLTATHIRWFILRL
ncbi:hypothetical protein HDU76_013814 [Blyttiomyces sp. JEL0837]|nr:hypothetical protein HDU76_013814 [Blyttiomyces sp. JEL0837]